LFVACAETGADDDYRLETLESGVSHAVNLAPSAADPDERWAATVSLQLGELDGEGPEVFGAVTALEVDDDGSIYVLDGQAQEIRVFASDESYLRSMGGRGEGPGEFTGAAGLNWSPDSRLWVWDPRLARFSAFTPSGEFTTVAQRRVLGVVYPWAGDLVDPGSMIDWGVDFPEMTSSMDPGRIRLFHPVRTDLTNGTFDSLPPLRYEAESNIDPRAPFHGGLTFTLGPGNRIWFGTTTDYRIHGRTLAGDTVLVISLRGVEPELVTAAERDSILRRPDPIGEATGNRLAADQIPSIKPILARLVTDGEGTLYVFPRVPLGAAGTLVDIFETREGRYLGRVTLPVQLVLNPPPVAVPGALVGVTRGELDVPHVVRITISRRQP
jgi:hypothetical protein